MRPNRTAVLVAFSAVLPFSFLLRAQETKPAQGQPTARTPAKAEARPRAREIGIAPGRFQTGERNAITDVPGVRVGQVTLNAGDSVRTGVTAILPHSGNLFGERVAGAVHVFNAFGKLAGSTQVNELGQIETPIVLTNTLSVWDAAAAVVDWTLAQPGNENVRSVNPLVGETNDGWLNDIRGRHVRREHVLRAIAEANEGDVAEGSVGAGTGTVAFGWKGGIGTSSRRMEISGRPYTLGVLVQTNFGGNLTVNGVPVWKSLQPPRERASASGSLGPLGKARNLSDGSCMIVVATDAPVDARQLRRIAARAVWGMARAGSDGSHGSGDFVIAFSTGNRIAPPRRASAATRHIDVLNEDSLSPLLEAAIEATEEAIYNSLLRATTVRGHAGHTAEAIPIERLRELLARKR